MSLLVLFSFSSLLIKNWPLAASRGSAPNWGTGECRGPGGGVEGTRPGAEIAIPLLLIRLNEKRAGMGVLGGPLGGPRGGLCGPLEGL